MDEMFKDFEFNEKTEYEIEEVNGVILPKEYLDFMKEHNSGEGPILENAYARLFKLEELNEINEEYEVSKYWDNYFVFGTDGGDMLLGYNSKRNLYYAVDSYNANPDEIFYEASSLKEFFQKMDEE